MSRATINHPAPHEWDAFVAQHPHGHLMQLSGWGALKSRFGWSVERVGLPGDASALVAGAQLFYRPLPLRLGCVAYIPKGPLVDWQDAAQVTALVAALDRAARAQGAIALTIEPDLPDGPENAARLSHAGFIPGAAPIQPRRTLLVDLTPDEEAILAAMKSKTRYNIRLAARKGVSVRQGGAADLGTFYRLMTTTSARDRFGIHSLAYYCAAYELFAPRHAVLLLAEFQGQPLAGLMAFALGSTAWYFYGASSNQHRNLMAPYALQWAAMRWAKERGCTVYDLWGVPDEEEERLEADFTRRRDGLWGVYRFKRGFGGQLVRTVGAWDRVYRPLRYRLYRWALRRRRAG